MKIRIAAALAVSVLLSANPAFAHRIDEYLQATILSLQSNRVEASMRLIPGILVAPSVIAGIDSNGDGTLSGDEEQVYAQRVLGDLSITIDGKPVQTKLISWSFPQPTEMRAGVGEIHIAYVVDLPRGGRRRSLILTNHHLSRSSVYLVNVVVPEDPGIRFLAQRRNEQQSVYELDYEQMGAAVPSRTSWAGVQVWLSGIQFSSLFHLGMRHIAEGTDHLLFLLTLLLPAPLLASAGHWGPAAGVRTSLLRILGIVTAFTIGHSATLSLAALGFLHVPSRPIEVLIAVSIFISALHALHPILPGKEAWIAVFFGLIHGLAFAATLDRLGLGHWERVAGILAFNLGIETMQMIVVAAVLPSLLLMSRTRAYQLFRIGGAMCAGIASFAWVAERLFNLETHVDIVVNALARYAPTIAVVVFITALTYRLLLASRRPEQSAETARVRRLPITASLSEDSGIPNV
jgi:hypothetical protein